MLFEQINLMMIIPNGGAKYAWGGEIFRLVTNDSLCLDNRPIISTKS